MQVIPDKLDITTGQHVFETPEDIVINSQIYDKITMEPKPYNFFNMNTVLTNKNLLLHNVNILEYPTNIHKEPDYKYYIQDTQNSDIFYCLSEIGPGNKNQYLHKIKKSKNGWTVEKSISPDAGYRWYSPGQFNQLLYKILGQTDQYVILMQQQSGSSFDSGNWNHQGNALCTNLASYIAINKNTMTAKTINIGNNQNIGIYTIKETPNCIYTIENLAGRIYVARYEPETNTRVTFYSNTSYVDSNCMGLSSVIFFQNQYCMLIGNSSKYYMLRLSIDFDYNKVVAETNVITNMPLHNATNRTDALDRHWLAYSLKNIDDTYISITSHDQTNAAHVYTHRGVYTYSEAHQVHLAQTVLSTLGWHRHYLFKFEDDTFKFKSTITPDETNQHIYGLIYYDEYTPIFLTNKRIMGYRLNLETEKYEKCFEKAGTYYTLGIDENNKVYTFDNSNKCSIYNDVTSYELFAEFEKPNYTYNNSDIDTYVVIYSKNFVNNYIKTKVEITLDGACKFTSNGKKKIVTYTDPDGKLNIPVTVYYGGTVYCYIKEVE